MPPEAAPGDWDQARRQLDQGLVALNLDLPAASRDQLIALLRLLA
jgi:hypothetical protein